jgi:hypothetical protein
MMTIGRSPVNAGRVRRKFPPRRRSAIQQAQNAHVLSASHSVNLQ